jgi:2-polyprenyl-3-methyl-5-hydroxy-6-metoxy-1,4-benzoquinol methylase
LANENQQKFSVQEDKPADWFEPLYADANKEGKGVPWANMDTHPSFKAWLDKYSLIGKNKKALVIGCGMGDDAIELEKLGFDVTAFDVSDSAIKFCQERFPHSSVNFLQADLLKSQKQWHKHFDFVLEIYTVQALPPKYEIELIQNIASFVAPAGQLLVVAEVNNEERDFKKGPPWLLTPQHIDAFITCNLTLEHGDIEHGALDNDSKTYVSTFRAFKN